MPFVWLLKEEKGEEQKDCCMPTKCITHDKLLTYKRHTQSYLYVLGGYWRSPLLRCTSLVQVQCQQSASVSELIGTHGTRPLWIVLAVYLQIALVDEDFCWNCPFTERRGWVQKGESRHNSFSDVIIVRYHALKKGHTEQVTWTFAYLAYS